MKESSCNIEGCTITNLFLYILFAFIYGSVAHATLNLTKTKVYQIGHCGVSVLKRAEKVYGNVHEYAPMANAKLIFRIP